MKKRNVNSKSTDSNNSILYKTVYVYTLDGKLKGEYSLNDYIAKSKLSLKSIESTATSYKGYGFVTNNDKKEFISFNPITHFYTSKEVMDMFSKWYKKYFEINKIKVSNMFPKDSEEDRDDYISMALMYIVNTINSPESNNNFEASFVYKYKMCRLDVLRARKVLKKHGHVDSAKDVLPVLELRTDCDFNLLSNISERSIFDNGEVHNCVADENYSKQIESIGIILKQYLPSEKVDLFLAVIEWERFEFDTKPEFKPLTLFVRYKEHILYLKSMYPSLTPDISNTKYTLEILEECWSLLTSKTDEIKDFANNNKYKEFDDYTLFDFINETDNK